MPRLLSKTTTVQRSSRPAMATSPSQEPKNRPIPQLSCLDPCSNCTSSGVACMPIYRPRLPRGRYGRPARSRTSSPANERYGGFTNSKAASTAGYGELNAPIDELESFVPEGEASRLGPIVEGKALQELVSQVSQKIQSATTSTKNDLGTIVGDLSQHIRRLESLLQEAGSGRVKINATSRNADVQERLQPENPEGETMQIVQTTLGLETQQPPALPTTTTTTTSFARQSPDISGNDVWTGLTSHEVGTPTARTQHGNSEAIFNPRKVHDPPKATDLERPSVKTDSLRNRELVNNNGLGTLGLLNIGNSLSPSFMSLPRDKLGATKLCQLYLQNVDPIIKILHRPSLSRWMLDGASTYLGIPEDSNSVTALASAICYIASYTMTEAQCQATFQQNKSSIMTVHRRMCESASEKASLLTTRDMMVLQAFMLYLVRVATHTSIGRRSEDKDTAAWALVALAVRLARAIGLDQEPKKPANARESFFQQQMRLRLWLTVCLVDIQGDAACAIPTVAHINDSDFDVTTEHAAVGSQEQLTETTFALVTYHVQVAGRALNFGSPDCSTAAERHQLARQVQQQVFTLLHYCDPESSPYAWFTWHSTQSIVSAIRLSELLPFRCNLKPGSSASPPSPRGDGDLSLLRWALQNLEKAQLLCTDPRGSGFRGYITIPCLALSTAIAECNTCSDVETVRRAWPVVEASYRQHEELLSSHDCQSAPAHLVQMINKIREKLSSSPSSLLQESDTTVFDASQAVEVSAATDTLMVPMVPAAGRHNPIDPQLSSGLPLSESGMPPASFIVAQPQLGGHQSWNLATMPMDDVHARNEVLLTTDVYHSLQSDYF
ncbi:hypothetical protein ASPBRDRAFT_59496 [Aspergillus brasiliensis CBS 101740]|uniref:Xylanolytic transcriptional activator regulatory domain-containing protein n=1 Tax=Aspergillus brasiliensis (strain CBS 101740 / IMI 381727 / IBT 21946) TaxID=767769 RepID=A0A1L9U4V6_ASPBC|nr:hypothetical protein ASPBRDRAFT_59496 [Aspergillus brasiliensis CBS 101740]